jgi:hypothetical protein
MRMVKVKIYGTLIHPKLKKEVKEALELAVRKQNTKNFVDYDEMAWDVTEKIEKFIESQDLKENR